MINENELVARVCADIDWAIRVARMYAITTNVNYNAVKRLEGIATHLAAWEALMDVLSYIDADGAAFKPCSVATCRGPAPTDPGYSKERWPRRLFIC